MNINLKTCSIEDINNFKSTLDGKNIRNMTQLEMYNMYKGLYDDGYDKDIYQLSKIQIRNRLVDRLDMTIVEKNIYTDLGIDSDYIERFIRDVLVEVTKDERVKYIDKDDLDFTIKFWQGWRMSDLRRIYSDYYTTDRDKFQRELDYLFNKDNMIEFETKMYIEKNKS